MMFELKPISAEAIPTALERAHRYRLLNEPREAESICLDILAVEPDDQDALVILLLALTDQFEWDLSLVKQARAILPRLQDEYSRVYYEGVIAERQAKANLGHSRNEINHVACEWFLRAMDSYEKAETIRPPGNDEALFRWNTCARILMRNPGLVPHPAGVPEPMLE